MMQEFTSTVGNDSARPLFRRQWHRLVIPCAFAVLAFGMFAYRVPNGVWYAAPGLGVILGLAVGLHRGVVLTRDGIEWFVVQPRWRYRRVPWSALIEVRPGWFGAGQAVRLVVADGRYEPWVWGTPKVGGRREVVITTRDLAGGAALYDAILQAWEIEESATGGVPVG
jgi:hypothetical protein